MNNTNHMKTKSSHIEYIYFFFFIYVIQYIGNIYIKNKVQIMKYGCSSQKTKNDGIYPNLLYTRVTLSERQTISNSTKK